jgi:hypothetical protein
LLEEQVGLVAAYEEFQVEEIRYLWSGEYQAKNAYDIEPHRKIIDATCRLSAENNPIPLDSLVALRRDGLVHVLPKRQQGSVRFYVILVPLPGISFHRVRGLEVVVKALREEGLGSSTTVYSGIGFASHLLSFSAPSFEAVREGLERVAPLARLLNMRTMTMLVANNDANESDILNLDTEISPELAALANILGGEYETRVIRLQLDEQHEIGEVFRHYTHLLSTPFSGLFLSLMQARIDKNFQELNRELIIVLHFESLLKLYIQELFQAYLGDDWERKVEEIALLIPKIGHEVLKDFRFSFLSIGALAQIANRMVTEGLLPDADLKRTLGPDWVSDLETFASAIRNPLAHGATFGEAFARTFIENWRTRAELLCRIGDAYNQLLRRAQANEMAKPDDASLMERVEEPT